MLKGTSIKWTSIEVALKRYIKVNVKDPGLLKICLDVVEDRNFRTCPGSKGHHHAYEGGLLVHTYEVVKNVVGACSVNSNSDVETAVIAAVFHDSMKMQEYKIDDEGDISTTRYRNFIRHVAGSYAYFELKTQHLELTDHKRQSIGHCILSHHGRPEWGSAVEPQTIEAQILHNSDMVSARYGKNLKEIVGL